MSGPVQKTGQAQQPANNKSSATPTKPKQTKKPDAVPEKVQAQVEADNKRFQQLRDNLIREKLQQQPGSSIRKITVPNNYQNHKIQISPFRQPQSIRELY